MDRANSLLEKQSSVYQSELGKREILNQQILAAPNKESFCKLSSHNISAPE